MAFPMTAAAKTDDSIAAADGLRVYVTNNAGNSILVKEYTLKEAEKLCGDTQFYSSIDSYPTGVLTAAKGIDLEDYTQKLASELGATSGNMPTIVMRSTDKMEVGYQSNGGYFYPELFNKKYYNDDENILKTYTSNEANSIIASRSALLKPVLAVLSYQGRIGALKADYRQQNNLSANESVTLDQLKEFTESKMDHISSSRFCSVQTDDDILLQRSTTHKVTKYIYKIMIQSGMANPEGQKLENPTIVIEDVADGKAKISVKHPVKGVTIRYGENKEYDPVIPYSEPIIVKKPSTGSVDYHFIASKIGYADSNAVLAQVTNQPQVSLAEVTTFSELQQAVANSTPGQTIKIKNNFHPIGSWPSSVDITGKDIILDTDNQKGVTISGIAITGKGTLTVKKKVTLETDNLASVGTDYYTNGCTVIFEGDLGDDTAIGADNSTIIVNGNINYLHENRSVEMTNGTNFTLNGNIQGTGSMLIYSKDTKDKVVINGDTTSLFNFQGENAAHWNKTNYALSIKGTAVINGNIMATTCGGIYTGADGNVIVNGNIQAGQGYAIRSWNGESTVFGNVSTKNSDSSQPAVKVEGTKDDAIVTVLGTIAANEDNGIGASAMNKEGHTAVFKYTEPITAKYPLLTNENLDYTEIELLKDSSIGTYIKANKFTFESNG
ncbi:MAG: hypothetical protein RR131_09875, partial [Anaerovorax sp.]